MLVGCWLVIGALTQLSSVARANDQSAITADKLLSTGQLLTERTHYLEALDLLQEAKDKLDAAGTNNTAMYADVLFALAQTKIKARNLQDFPAYYVKTALQDIQATNKLREKLSNVLPQKLAEGYYLEGYINKKFFVRKSAARSCFEKAKNIDPGSVAAKRELYELDAEEQK
ncbi:MAG: hypothetical protein ACLP5H_12350 [Desulfomonilaceae bacterium]